MRLQSLLVVALFGLLGACAEAPASLLATAGPIVPAGTPDRAPASFTGTCARSPALCDLPDPGPVALAETPATLQKVGDTDSLTVAISINLTANAAAAAGAGEAFDPAKAMRLLQAVNSAVNGRMARDMTLLVNPADDWTPAIGTSNGLVGDCKNFAAEKRRRLIAAGFPADRLFYAVVFREDIGLHALLMAHLDGGDYALDSRQPWVTPWYEAGYTYVQRQVLGDQMQWTNLVAPPAAAAPILLAQGGPAATAMGAGSR